MKSSTSSAHCDETEGVLDPIVLYVVIPAVISTPSDEDVVPQIFLCGSLRENGVSVQFHLGSIKGLNVLSSHNASLRQCDELLHLLTKPEFLPLPRAAQV